MKRVSPARAAAFEILMRVEQGAFADELLHSSRLDKLSPPDRGLCTEIVMGVLRWRSALDATTERATQRRLSALDLEVLMALRMGLFQLKFLDRIPARAAVDESVELVKAARKTSAAPLVNAALRRVSKGSAEGPVSLWQAFHTRETVRKGGSENAARDLAQAFAHPEWLVRRWIEHYDAATAERICAYDQTIPVTALRVSDPSVESKLREEGIELTEGALLKNARRVVSGDVTKTKPYREGRVAIQDEGSQMVPLLVGSGKRLLDCCAAPGGKTAMLAERNPEGRVVAAERYPQRARLLRRRVQVENVRVIAADAGALPLAGDFDRILADVPCSGTGTLARNPEIKWRLKPEDLTDLHGRQVAILRGALEQLAPGGRMVYSSCSLEREENQDVLEEALRNRVDLRIVDVREELRRLKTSGELAWEDAESLTRGPYLRTIPGLHLCDGFFAGIVERIAADSP